MSTQETRGVLCHACLEIQRVEMHGWKTAMGKCVCMHLAHVHAYKSCLLLLGALLYFFSICCDHIAFRETSWHLSDSTVTWLCEQEYICLCFCDGEPPRQCLLGVWQMCRALPARNRERRKKWAVAEFLPWYRVVSCYCVEVKRGRYNPAAEAEKQGRGRLWSRDWHSGFPLLLEFKEFWEEWSEQWDKKFDEFFMRISGRIWDFSKQSVCRNIAYVCTTFILVCLGISRHDQTFFEF